jgi:alanine transaminase
MTTTLPERQPPTAENHNEDDKVGNDIEDATSSTDPPSLQPAFISSSKRLTEDTMSPFLRRMEYAVRGSVVIAADKIDAALKEQRQQATTTKNEKKTNKYPFDKIVFTNIGNPQSVGQKPLTWPRQVLALVDLPDHVGVDHPDAHKLFPADAIRRAREIKQVGLEGYGSGAYSHSKGVKMFREDVCSFLQERDGKEVPTDPEDIFLSNGASAAIGNVLQALIADPSW